MNKDRRKELDAIMDAIEAQREKLDNLKEAFADIVESIESVRDDEQEYFDNMPESLQAGEKGMNAEAAVSQLEDAISAAREIADLEADMDAIIQALDAAKE